MKNLIKLLILVMFFNVSINAQNVKEAVQNTKQIIEGKKNLERDTHELKVFKLKLYELRTAVSQKKQDEVDRISKDLIVDMVREVAQSGVKAKKAKQEVAQSSAEVRSDRREIRNDKDDSKKGRYDRRDDEKDLARDKANQRDDRRDRRDDIGDLNKQIERAKNQAEILQSLKVYEFTIEDLEREAYVIKKREIKKSFKEFMVLLKEDLEATKRELNEDIRESREDGRERRDDREERKEPTTNKKKKRRRG